MTSALHQHDSEPTQMNDSRTSPDKSTTVEQKLQLCSLSGIQEREDNCTVNKQDLNTSFQDTSHAQQRRPFDNDSKPRLPPPVNATSKRPTLQKKSYSDLVSYRNVHMRILVEGEEVLNTCLQGNCCFDNGSNSQSQSTATDDCKDFDRESNERGESRKPGKLLAGWFAKKTQLKTQNTCKSKEPPIGFRSLKRSKSFSGKIKDKIKSINPINSSSYSVGSPPKSKYLQPPLFYRTIDLQNINNYEDTSDLRVRYQRRHSDQTDSMSRRPLGAARFDLTPKHYSMSLERGLKQRTERKRPLVRKKSNSMETPTEFPFWSQISDCHRTRSCSARIRVSETRRDTDGTLETNLCSTEL